MYNSKFVSIAEENRLERVRTSFVRKKLSSFFTDLRKKNNDSEKLRIKANLKNSEKFIFSVINSSGNCKNLISGANTKTNISKMKTKINEIFSYTKNQDMRIFLTLTYTKNQIDEKESKSDLNNFFRNLRRGDETKKADEKLKYLWVLETQKRGAIHYHIVLNKAFKSSDIKRFWKHGRAEIRFIKNSVNNYISKYISKVTENLQFSKLYGYSRNLIEKKSYIFDFEFKDSQEKKIFFKIFKKNVSEFQIKNKIQKEYDKNHCFQNEQDYMPVWIEKIIDTNYKKNAFIINKQKIKMFIELKKLKKIKETEKNKEFLSQKKVNIFNNTIKNIKNSINKLFEKEKDSKIWNVLINLKHYFDYEKKDLSLLTFQTI